MPSEAIGDLSINGRRAVEIDDEVGAVWHFV
jgi:hypothetical protein